MKQITMIVIDHEKQRYDTVGDWYFAKDDPEHLFIFISKCSDWRFEQCVFIHELTEAVLCKARGITEKQVDEWDLSHEETGADFCLTGAPYEKEHYAACVTELFLGKEFGINYDAYLKELESFEQERTSPMKVQEGPGRRGLTLEQSRADQTAVEWKPGTGGAMAKKKKKKDKKEKE